MIAKGVYKVKVSAERKRRVVGRLRYKAAVYFKALNNKT